MTLQIPLMNHIKKLMLQLRFTPYCTEWLKNIFYFPILLAILSLSVESSLDPEQLHHDPRVSLMTMWSSCWWSCSVGIKLAES